MQYIQWRLMEEVSWMLPTAVCMISLPKDKTSFRQDKLRKDPVVVTTW